MEGRLSSEKIRVRVSVLVAGDEGVLLVRHEKAGRTYWLLPGGGLEYGETLKQAAHRETLEETGLDVAIGDLALVWETLAPDGSRHLVNLCFSARVASGTLRASQDSRVHEARFITLGELRSLDMHPPLAEPIETLVKRPEEAVMFLGPQWTP
jgi:ADP-ribose pyrophosphatase YjhB (NUDIX family)